MSPVPELFFKTAALIFSIVFSICLIYNGLIDANKEVMTQLPLRQQKNAKLFNTVQYLLL